MLMSIIYWPKLLILDII